MYDYTETELTKTQHEIAKKEQSLKRESAFILGTLPRLSFYTFLLGIFSLLTLPEKVQAQSFDVDTLVYNGDPANHINFVYLGDGFTNAQMNQFISKAITLNNAIFNTPPFSNYKSYFNAFAIKVPSSESGAKHAGTATDVTEPASPIKNPNNYFSSAFDVSSIHRLLVGQSFQVQNVAFANFPQYDQVLLIVNDNEYGGSGGSIATGSVNGAAAEIMIHEIGHSFANLGDEYWFNCSEVRNRTANNNPATIIWKNWLNSNGIGIYPIGTSGPSASCYRPHQNCKMRALGQPFCAVCKEAIIDRIYQLVSPINGFSPAGNEIDFNIDSMAFSLDLELPYPNTLKITWLLNGDTIRPSVDSIVLANSELQAGQNNLQVIVTDNVNMSRSYWPASSGYLHAVSWTITQSPLEVDDLNFLAVYDGRKVKLSWESKADNKTSHFSIQKSRDGLRFSSIGQEPAKTSEGLNQYLFIDSNPLSGVAYYRLDKVDFDGKTEEGPIRTVNKIDKVQLTIFPNPVEDVLSISVHSEKPESAAILVYDVSGRLILKKDYVDIAHLNEDIETQTWPPGEYFLEIKIGDLVKKEVVVKQ